MRTRKSIYVEPFFGSGTVFFNIRPFKKEFINDNSLLIYNFFKVLQDEQKAKELQEFLNKMIVHEKFFYEIEDYLKTYKSNDNRDNIQLAAYFFYYNYFSMNGINGLAKKKGTFFLSYQRNRIKFFRNRINIFNNFSQRLKYCTILCRDGKKVIKQLDNNNTIFYIDPPYYKEGKYFLDSNKDFHIELANILKNLKGNFILSYNDHEFIRNLYNEFNIITLKIKRNYSAFVKKKREEKTELLIYNFDSYVFNTKKQIKNKKQIILAEFMT